MGAGYIGSHAKLGIQVRFVRIGLDAWPSVPGTYRTALGLGPGGAALVRPDGYIAWRSIDWPADPASALAGLAQRVHHPSRPGGPAAAREWRRPLTGQLRHRTPGQIGILLIKNGQAHRVGDSNDFISHWPERFRHLQFVTDHGGYGARCSPQPSAAAALRVAFLAAAGRAHLSADVTAWGLSRPNLLM